MCIRDRTKTIRDQLDQEGYKAQSIEEVMRAEDQSGETLGYAFTVVTSEGYGGDIQFSMGVQNLSLIHIYSEITGTVTEKCDIVFV